jgi:hypothetical protein
MAAEYKTISAEQNVVQPLVERRNTVFSHPSDERSRGMLLNAELKFLQKS